jgi:glycerol-3-phosphate acyltransferase PlsY
MGDFTYNVAGVVGTPWIAQLLTYLLPLTVAATVIGHNYSMWLAIRAKKWSRTGKGLATGAGALLAYDWRYFVAVVVIGLAVIAITRYMMAGQVAAAFTLPVAALLLRSPDWPFALIMGLFVYAAHHKRFMGLLQGREPKLYVDDGSGPRG